MGTRTRSSASSAVQAISGLYPGRELVVTDEIHRRSSDLYVIRVSEIGSRIVKFEPGRTAAEVESISTNAAALHSCVSSASERLSVVTIVGITCEPSGVVMEFVEGGDLSGVIAHAAANRSTVPERARAHELVRLAGVALGGVHRRSVCECASPTRTGACVRSAGDFAPYNIRVSADGRLTVVDVPHHRRCVTVHEDAAHFLAGMARSVHEVPQARARAGRRLVRELTESFLSGYAEQAVLDLRVAPHRALLSSAIDRVLLTIGRKLAVRRTPPEYVILWRLLPAVAPALARSASRAVRAGVGGRRYGGSAR